MNAHAARASRLARLLRAPLSALVRGRLRHRWPEMIDASDLPPTLRELASQVVARTRLWPGEREDVARELCAHFADGLCLGRSADDLARSFGDPGAAARMIRRAKRRSRPLAWILWVRAWQALGCVLALLLAVYVVLLARFAAGEPTVARNFTREMNERILATRPEDRAWPVYARVFINLADAILARTRDADGQQIDLWAVRPGQPHWDELVRVLRAHAADLADLRQATRLPAQGLALSDATPPELHEWSRRVAAEARQPEPVFAPPSDNPFLVTVFIPSLGHARTMARVLCADARLALTEGDPDRALDNWTATLDLSRHQLEHPVLIAALVSVAIDALVFDEVGQALADQAEALGDAHLARLVHRLAAVPDMPLARALEGERAFFLDFLQRAYTDDGSGDGRLTPAGVALMDGLAGEGFGAEPRAGPTQYVAGAGLLALDVGRRRVRQEHERVLDAMLRHADTPLWRRPPLTTTVELERLASDPIRSASMKPIALLTPALEKAAQQADLHAAHRDAAATAIALEIHRRRRGGYPATIAGLVPDFLPAVPIDRFSGDPFGYLPAGAPWSKGKPVLYSVGANLQDDAGELVGSNPRPAWQTRETLDRWKAVNDPRLRDPAYQGDWILWPKPPEPEKPAE
ncbi:MAG: hypothetical protein FJ255_11945 [Phycisphaerae bacterium]|nr:hypothetical protein [Phycisphaerae bacterium]